MELISVQVDYIIIVNYYPSWLCNHSDWIIVQVDYVIKIVVLRSELIT